MIEAILIVLAIVAVVAALVRRRGDERPPAQVESMRHPVRNKR